MRDPVRRSTTPLADANPVQAPRPAVVYRFFDATGDLLYVGISLRLDVRLRGHARTQPWWTEAVSATFSHYPDISAARQEELRAIRDERPRYNVADTPKPPKQLTLLPTSWRSMRPRPTKREMVALTREAHAAFTAFHRAEALQQLREDELTIKEFEADYGPLTAAERRTLVDRP